jgi:hypothetical protein
LKHGKRLRKHGKYKEILWKHEKYGVKIREIWWILGENGGASGKYGGDTVEIQLLI